MKKIVLTLFLFFLLPSKVMAVEDPLAVPNNRFGIHIIDQGDLERAHELVNSSGGDWGYVTLVIREDQRKTEYWQEVFDAMRKQHLIPIVRLASRQQGGVWTVPQEHELGEWAGFLNSLNWVVKNRYVVLFNEPNHAKEWGGTIRPDEYAKTVVAFHRALKNASEDFFILPAGLDAAAPNGADTMTARTYWERMHAAEPDVFTLFDGWTSHSYPNPGFVGSVTDSGLTSIRGFESELSVVRPYGIDADIPVFITETGWQHYKGKRQNGIATDIAASNYKTAYEGAWNNPQIVAVTPFILNYPSEPFDMFSWIDYATNEPLPQFTTVQEMAKVAGKPVQIDDSTHSSVFLPTTLVAGSHYTLALRFKNTGQSIWNADEVNLQLTGTVLQPTITVDSIPEITPGTEVKVWVTFTVPEEVKQGEWTFQLTKNGQPMGQPVIHTFSVVPRSNLLVRLGLWFKHLMYPRDFLMGLSQLVIET